MIQIAQPFQNFVDTSGQPLDNGYVYIGTADQNPEANAIAVYWDAALTIPAAQPIRTISGYLSRNGSPARLYADASRYSITVRDRNSAIVITTTDASTLDNLRADLAASSGSSMVGHISTVAGATLRTLQGKGRDFLNVEDCPGADFTAKLLAGLAHVNTNGGELRVKSGTAYTLTGSTGLTLDVGKASLVADGVVAVDCSGFTGANVLQVYSSLAYPLSHFRNGSNKASGIVFTGNKTAGRHGLLVGHATNTNNGQTVLEGMTFAGFDRCHHFTDNAWRPVFRNCGFSDALNYTLYYPAGISNAGEVVHYDHCMIFDGAGNITVAGDNAQIQCFGTSILNQPVILSGSAIKWQNFGGNIENPANAVPYTYVTTSGAESEFAMHGTSLVMNSTATFTDSPFDAAHATSRILFDDVLLPVGANLQFETAAGVRAFVKGAGLGLGRNIKLSTGGTAASPCLSLGQNEMHNGNLEQGSTAGWTVATYGADALATFVASAAAKKNGTYGGLMTTVAGGINATQTIPCRAGSSVIAQCWAKVATLGAAPAGFFQYDFLDNAGAAIIGFSDQVSGSTFALYGLGSSRVAPPGTYSLRVTLNGQPGNNVVWWDDVILNVF